MNRHGQNIVEYLLLVALVVMVCIVFLGRRGPMENSLKKTVGTVDASLKRLNAEIGLDGKPSSGLHSQ